MKEKAPMKNYLKFGLLIVAVLGTLAWLAVGGISETKTYYKTVAELKQFTTPEWFEQYRTVVGGMLEHIEFAGVHSGDAAMVLPPHTLSKSVIETIREYTHAMARDLE